LEIFGQIWNQGVVGSLEWGLKWLNDLLIQNGLNGNLVSSWALTIILFTVVIKLVTLPLTLQQLRSSKALQDIQPHMSALQKQHAKDKEKLMQEQMKLYKEHNVNPAAGCLPMLIQMPIWIGLYQALFALAGGLENSHFFWITSLAHPEISSASAIIAWPPAIPVLAILTGVTQWIVQKMMTPRSTDPQQKMMQSMMQFMPLMFVFFSLSVPAGLVLYWVTSNLFSMAQQYFITGWGSLAPATAVVAGKGGAVAKVGPAVVTGSGRRSSEPLVAASAAGLPALPEQNGHSGDKSAVQRAVPQAPSSARKRRRRAK
jgi:YidC/Oxa1 family membrane protein insertase